MKLFRIHSSRVALVTVLCALGMQPSAAIAQWTPSPPGGGDPYTSNASVFNEDGDLDGPMLPWEFEGEGSFCFKVGNNTGTAIGYDADATPAQLVKFTVSVTNGRPKTTTPYDPTQALAVLTGPLLTYFDVIYVPPVDTNDPTEGGVYSGTQIAQLDGNTSFQACFPYLVTANKFDPQGANPKNGANVNIQRPGYLDGNGDTTDNNKDSSYTFVEAKDYGDAPTSYGVAEHELDLETNINGEYVNYFYFGSVVDPEDNEQDSIDATGDDANQTGGLSVDDEDGVTFPAGMVKDMTYNIPVTYTVEDTLDTGITFWSAWIDWNRDGIFDDSAEKVAANQFVPGTGTANLSVAVPADAVDGIYFARFRIGQFGVLPTGTVTQGEVEDYAFPIGDPTAVTIGSVDLQAASVTDFLNDLGVDQMGIAALRDILRAWDPSLAASAGTDHDAVVTALQEYLDPDGDGQVAVLHWDTLEERGTVGFYVERSDANGEGATLINNDMLPGLISAPMGGEYMLADPVPTSGDVYQYRFIEQEATGNKREYGPYKLEMPQ